MAGIDGNTGSTMQIVLTVFLRVLAAVVFGIAAAWLCRLWVRHEAGRIIAKRKRDAAAAAKEDAAAGRSDEMRMPASRDGKAQ